MLNQCEEVNHSKTQIKLGDGCNEHIYEKERERERDGTESNNNIIQEEKCVKVLSLSRSYFLYVYTKMMS